MSAPENTLRRRPARDDETAMARSSTLPLPAINESDEARSRRRMVAERRAFDAETGHAELLFSEPERFARVSHGLILFARARTGPILTACYRRVSLLMPAIK